MTRWRRRCQRRAQPVPRPGHAAAGGPYALRQHHRLLRGLWRARRAVRARAHGQGAAGRHQHARGDHRLRPGRLHQPQALRPRDRPAHPACGTSQSYAFRCKDGGSSRSTCRRSRSSGRASLRATARTTSRPTRISTTATTYPPTTRPCATSSARPSPRGRGANGRSALEAEDVPYAPVLGPPEVFDGPAGAPPRHLLPVAHPPKARCAASTRRCASTAPARRTIAAPPTLGEHTDAVLGELGCAPAEIEELRAARWCDRTESQAEVLKADVTKCIQPRPCQRSYE